MAKERIINTRFWSDSFIVELNPLDRYLFLYLLTNEHTNICGIYELPLKRMSDETGIEKEMLMSMIKRFGDKVQYIDGWVAMKNFAKHQRDNASVKIGIANAVKLIPPEIMKQLKGFSSLSTVTPQTDTDWHILKPKLKLKSKLKLKVVEPSSTSEVEVWNYQDKIKEMQTSEKPIDRLLSFFWVTKGFTFENSKQLSMQYGRDCKAAKKLLESGYSKEKIKKGFEYVEKKYSDVDWNISTVTRFLAEANK